ncbi:MAG: sporulation transcription factor Spo0A [Clostridia bacterium]|nr:sporulation transcription factor Spo0A [Clostridia bacterium]
MNKRTVFLLQDTKEQIDKLKSMFSEDKTFEVVGEGTNAPSAIQVIAERKPKFIVLDLILAGYDGVWAIDRIKALECKPKIIVVSALNRDEIVAKAVRIGADYFMAKPINFQLLLERMLELEEEKTKPRNAPEILFKNTIDEKVSNIFINVGIPPHIKGYAFLREAVKMAIDHPEIVNNITKRLYPSIGEKFNTTASKVERAIRHAIEVAWSRGRIEAINNILGVRAFVGKEKPTNGEFIALVADKMLLEQA